MDIFSRVIAAYRVDLVIAVVASVISLGIGAMLGVISGYYRNFGSESIARLADAAQSFPLFVLAMALVAATGPSAVNIIIVLGVLNIPMFIRLVRTRTYSLRESSYIEAARALGMRDRRLIMRHLLPNASPPALIQFSVNVGWAILFTAGLSFVGAGVRTPTPEWGLMVAAGAPSVVTGQWWPALFPGIFIGLTVFAFALVGDALENLLDPTRR
jgi:peptide/nickel transport system permease protein